MVCFPEMLFLLSALAPYALSTVDTTCATAVGHDAPTHADLDLSVKYQESTRSFRMATNRREVSFLAPSSSPWG